MQWLERRDTLLLARHPCHLKQVGDLTLENRRAGSASHLLETLGKAALKELILVEEAWESWP